jgi:hypothetical protein
MVLRPLRLGLLAIASVLAMVLIVPNASAATASQAQSAPRNVSEQLARYPGGTQVSANEVSYKGGTVIVSFPSATQASTWPSVSPWAPNQHGCPAGDADNRWYCFYEHKDFGGRMVKWNLAHCGNDWIAFNDVGFNNQTSSWVNTGALSIAAWDGKPHQSTGLWNERPYTEVSYVGNTNNDRASAFVTSCK